MEAILLQKNEKRQKDFEEEDLLINIVKGLEDARQGKIRIWKH